MIYEAKDIIGKSLIARKQINVYSLPDAKAQYKIAIVLPGNSCGVVYSYIQKPDGLYWMFYNNTKPYYIKHSTGAFDVNSLKIQGVLTTEQKKEAERLENLNWIERQFEDLKQGGKKALIIVGVSAAIIILLKDVIKYKL